MCDPEIDFIMYKTYVYLHGDIKLKALIKLST